MGLFIEVVVDNTRLSAAQRDRLTALCPVDIFAKHDGQLQTRADQEDECTLCRLCLQAAPPGAITIRKLYSGEMLVSGESHE